MIRFIIIILFGFIQAQPGILKVGFDIDDTILYSEPAFKYYKEEYGLPIDYGWINSNDNKYSIPITPTVELVNFFKTNGHDVYFITARSGENGDSLAEYLSTVIGYKIRNNVELFFMPKDIHNGKKYTSKHRKINELELNLYYGDSDTDIIAALKAGIHPVRIVRHKNSVDQYSVNYFGNTKKGDSPRAPFDTKDLNIFYSKSVGIFGESIYPIFWDRSIDK